MKSAVVKCAATGVAALFALASANALAQAAPTAAAAKPPVAMEKHHSRVSPLVKSIQEALNKSGAKIAVDGRLGKETRAAIKAFQSSHGLKVTGRADKKTREALGLKS